MLVSSPIITVAGRDDRPVMTDTAVRYRPDHIQGRRYLVTASVLRTRTK
ncbi:hypothetical protein [Nocardia sp. NPDC057030]